MSTHYQPSWDAFPQRRLSPVSSKIESYACSSEVIAHSHIQLFLPYRTMQYLRLRILHEVERNVQHIAYDQSLSILPPNGSTRPS